MIKNDKWNLLGKTSANSLGVLKIGLEINKICIETFPKFKDVIVHIPVDKSVTPISQPYRMIPWKLKLIKI